MKKQHEEKDPVRKEGGLDDPDRRRDGTKGDLDLDKDGASHEQRRENEDASDSGGTGIPGFGV